MYNILSILTSLFIGLALGDDDLIVQINQGRLRGSTLESRGGRAIQAFQGIPYAKPPIQDLRFKEPVPADSWDGIFNATTEPPLCIQRNLFFYQQADIIVGSEDCLYLNVYTPKIPKKGDKKLLPVMFWISGGGHFALGGGLSIYGPQYLLDKDIVLVTINYRLGVLGFLSTEDDVLPGNYGLKDQVLAMKWVQKNIDKFGGDKKSVTIFGESAGSAHVGLHLLSPLSKGLFHKAIMGSGSPLNFWTVALPGWAKRRALAINTILGCPENPKEMIECLKSVPASQMVNVLNNLFEWRDYYPTIPITPVVEKCGKTSFLCKYPLRDFKQVSKVPVIIGITSSEGGLFASRMYNETGLVYTELEDNFKYYAAPFLQYKYTTKFSDLPQVADKLFKRYFPDGNLKNPTNAVNMISGVQFFYGVYKTALKLASPVYFYVYDYQNEFSINSLYGPYPYPKKLGVTHAEDLISLFENFPPTGSDTESEEDIEVSKIMVNIWTNFAINSKKVTIDGQKDGKAWPKFDTKTYQYVTINTSPSIVSKGTYVEEYKFLDSLPFRSAINDDDDKVKTSLFRDEF